MPSVEKKLPSYSKMAQPFMHSGLFTSIPKGQQRKLKLDLQYEVEGSGASFRFWGPEPLSSVDLRVLLGLVAFATNSHWNGETRRLLRHGRATRDRLALEGDALTQGRTVAVKFRLAPFAAAIGHARPGSRERARLEESIRRLAAVTMIAKRSNYEGSFRLLSYERDPRTDEFTVSLNPDLTGAILGKKDYLLVDLEAVQELSSVALLLYSRLHWIRRGSTRRIRLDRLVEYVNGETPAPSPKAASAREQAAIAGLFELCKIKWQVVELGRNLFEITRPRPVFPLPESESEPELASEPNDTDASV